MGPIARASAPNDLKIPKTDPFWSKLPYFEMSVVMQVTTNAVAVIRNIDVDKEKKQFMINRG